MPIQDYSTDPDLNVSISGINIAEGCPPSGINNAIRQLMADVKEESEAVSEAVSEASSALEAFAETQAAKDAAQDTAIAGKLDKSGGTMTGSLHFDSDHNIYAAIGANGGPVMVGTDENYANTGGEFYLFPTTHVSGGGFLLRMVKADGSVADLLGATGDLQWKGSPVLTSAGGTMTGTLHGNKNSSLVDFYHLSLSSIAGAGHGGYIDFHFNGSTEDFTSRIIEYDHILNLVASNGVWVNNSPVLTLVASGSNSNGWYRKWSDGWIEQGGRSPLGNYVTVTLPTPMSSSIYLVLLGPTGYDNDAVSRSITDETSTSFRIKVGYNSSITRTTYWYVCGY